MATNGVGSSTETSIFQAIGTRDAFSSLKVEDFLKMMITEMQNQDPLNPMDNSQILQQMSQMQSIQATTKLTGTLDSVLLEQNLTTASSLINKTIEGLDDEGNSVSGVVDSVRMDNQSPVLMVGDQQVSIANVRKVEPGTNDLASLFE